MYIKHPNLPDKKVKTVVVSALEKEIVRSLSLLGVNVIEIKENDYLEKNISSHPDMNFLHLGENKYISYEKVLDDRFEMITETKPTQRNYYNCTKLNMVIIGKYCICNKKTSSEYVQGINKELIYVNQGYTKCSTLIVDKNSIITGDVGIHKEVQKYGINSLFVDNSDITLNGYCNGFIGGIGGKLSNDILAISGRLNDLKEFDKIKSFTRNVGVYIEELTNNRIKDIGSIIPIETFN